MSANNKEKITSIILAGGRGTRMRSDATHKVVFEVGGVPVILRVLRNYKSCGVNHQIVVVGTLGEQVQRVVSARLPNVSYAWQPEPLGTGNATKCGARVLEDLGYDGLVFVAVGDRIVKPHIIHRLLNIQKETDSDVVFLVGHKDDNPSSGRIMFDGDQNAAAIVETSEIALSRLVAELKNVCDNSSTVEAAWVLERITDYFPTESKARKITGELYIRTSTSEVFPADELQQLLEPLHAKTTLRLWLDNRWQEIAASTAEDTCEQANLSTYLFRASALYEGLASLGRDNAQGEEFMTDCIKHLAAQRLADGSAQYKLMTVCVERPDDSMAFNTPEELAEIEHKLVREKSTDALSDDESFPRLNAILQPAGQWLEAFTLNTASVQGFLLEKYGNVPHLHESRREAYIKALECFIQTFSADRPAFIVRSPGRVNLVGSHIDHRGGNTNVVAISDEVIMVAAPREDDTITLCNTNNDRFTCTEFSISQEIANLEWTDWMNTVNSSRTLDMVRNGDWSNYYRAAALRLQERFRHYPLQGADIVAHGTIPIGSGLSSSSAVVVGAAEILVAVNELPVKANILVDLCGEGEWFVGTRGGAADHAAIKFGRRGQVAHVGFFPFEILNFVPFPEGYTLMVCDSGIQAKKSEGARATFNRKVLGYTVGEIIIKQLLPEFASSIHHLRDITCENLGLTLDELYEVIKKLPETLTKDALFREYGPFNATDGVKLRNLLATLEEDPMPFDVRGVTLYGLAEIQRAKRCPDYLLRGDVAGLGRLWDLSHNGDRLICHDENMQPVLWDYDVSIQYLDDLITDIRSNEPERVRQAQLFRQPGKYGCSTPEIDFLVDLVRRQPGVMGAQVAGAGLGGSVIILAEEAAHENVLEVLRGHGFSASCYYTVEGAGVVRLN